MFYSVKMYVFIVMNKCNCHFYFSLLSLSQGFTSYMHIFSMPYQFEFFSNSKTVMAAKREIADEIQFHKGFHFVLSLIFLFFFCSAKWIVEKVLL